MLGHLIDALSLGGITNFVITTAPHSHQEVNAIVSSKNLKSKIVKISNNGFRQIPYEVKEYLDDRFFLVFRSSPTHT